MHSLKAHKVTGLEGGELVVPHLFRSGLFVLAKFSCYSSRFLIHEMVMHISTLDIE